MIYLGSDHRGYPLKEEIKALLSDRGLEYTDKGTDSEERADFPDFAFPVAEAVGKGSETDYGILICGSGAGMTIAANKVSGARAALATDPEVAAHLRENDHGNILVLASDSTSGEEARAIVDAFLNAKPDEDEAYVRRKDKITAYENNQ